MFRRIPHPLLFLFLAAVSATAKPDAVLDWNAIMLTTLEGQTPLNEP
jgi:hypothetical protein